MPRRSARMASRPILGRAADPLFALVIVATGIIAQVLLSQ